MLRLLESPRSPGFLTFVWEFPRRHLPAAGLRWLHALARRALMAAPPRRLERLALRLLTTADAACNRLYGWRANPLYQSGTIVIALLLVLILTGLWLIYFYRV